MDELKINELLDQATGIYNSALGRMPGLEKWAESFENSDEAIFAQQFYNYVLDKNKHPATRVFCMDSFTRWDFLEYLSSNRAA